MQEIQREGRRKLDYALGDGALFKPPPTTEGVTMEARKEASYMHSRLLWLLPPISPSCIDLDGGNLRGNRLNG